MQTKMNKIKISKKTVYYKSIKKKNNNYKKKVKIDYGQKNKY